MVKINLIGDICIDLIIKGTIPKNEMDCEGKFEYALGGNTSNSSIILHKLGVNVNFFSCVGNDVFGKFIMENHPVAEKIKIEKGNTGIALCFVKGKERSFLHDMGIIKNLRMDFFDETELIDADVIYIAGYDHLPSLNAVDLFKKAKEKNTLIFLDPGIQRDVTEELKYVDFLLVNKTEYNQLSTNNNLKEFRGTTILKKGSEGSVVLEDKGNEGISIPSEKVDVKDSTGAGDAFNAGFICKYMETKDPIESAKYANKIGALCVQKIGATNFKVI